VNKLLNGLRSVRAEFDRVYFASEVETMDDRFAVTIAQKAFTLFVDEQDEPAVR